MLLTITLMGIAGFFASGLVGMAGDRRQDWGQRLSALIAIISCLCGLWGAFGMLLGAPVEAFASPGPAPAMAINLTLGPLGAFFLVPIFLIGGLSSIYGLEYWRQSRHPRTARKLRFWYAILVVGMALLVLSGNSICFLIAWELVALGSFFLIATEDQKPASRQAAWIYLVATHVSTLLLVVLFILLRIFSGSFLLRPLEPGQADVGVQTAMFLLALTAFGIKAGMMPLHFWLPDAHANSPSHVSATLSGVAIKMGIFGLLRLLPLFPARPLGWGLLIVALGTTSSFLGVLWAIGQHDIKKLLAYHSVENIGIILLGLGLALVGETYHQPVWIVLGLGGSLLHVWNHALFKSLLFLSAGSVIHSARTREIDALGGLAKTMPVTAGLFFVGAVAICGLPPLNGFVSEWFIYMGLLHSISILAILGVVAAILAMVGALAAACFTKAYGTVFLGTPRTVDHHGHESGAAMWLPMLILAAGCIGIGIGPEFVAPVLDRVIDHWIHRPLPSLASLIPLQILAIINVILIGAAATGFVLQKFLRSVRATPTWACGYARPSSRMQYTAASLAQMLLGILRPLLRQRRHTPRISGVFAGPGELDAHVDDPMLQDVLNPGWQWVQNLLARGRIFQQGSIQSYLFFMLLALLILLLFALPIAALWMLLF